jgi:hypothetical protein
MRMASLRGAPPEDTQLIPPTGYHWLWERLAASYDSPVINTCFMTCFMREQIDTTKKNISVVGVDMSNTYIAPIVGILEFGNPLQVVLRGLEKLIQLDQEQMVIRFGTATVATRKFQIRGIVWESKDLDELLCIARSL